MQLQRNKRREKGRLQSQQNRDVHLRLERSLSSERNVDISVDHSEMSMNGAHTLFVFPIMIHCFTDERLGRQKEKRLELKSHQTSAYASRGVLISSVDFVAFNYPIVSWKAEERHEPFQLVNSDENFRLTTARKVEKLFHLITFYFTFHAHYRKHAAEIQILFV